MSTVLCPNFETCGGEIELTTYEDGDGDGAFTRTWTAVEIVGQTCQCELTESQSEALLKDAVETAGDWEP